MTQVKNVKVPLDIWRQLKVQSAREDSSMKEILGRAIELYLSTHAQVQHMIRPGSPTLKKLEDIVDALDGAHEIDQSSLSTTIGRIAGEDDRTVQKYMKLLLKYRYMVPVAPRVFRMNLDGEAGREMKAKVRDWMLG